MLCYESLLEIAEISELPAGVQRLTVVASRCPLLVCEKDTCFLTTSRTQNSLLHLPCMCVWLYVCTSMLTNPSLTG